MVNCVSVNSTEELVRRQQENEVNIISGGILRYRERVQKAEDMGRASETQPNTWMMQRFIQPVSKRLREQTDSALQGKAGVGAAQWARVFDRLDLDVCAFIGLKILQNMMFHEKRLTRTAVAGHIGAAIEEELQFNHMKAEDCRTYKYWIRQAETAVDRKTKQRCLIKLKKNYESLPEITHKQKVECGHLIIQATLDATFIAETFVEGHATRDSKPIECIRLTGEYRAEVETMHRRAETLWPRYEPMLCPPKPWDSSFGCGFVGELGRRTKLVRTGNRSYLEDLNNYIHKMPRVLSALNAVQATPFRINKRMVEILEKAVDAKGGWAFALPSMDDLPLPEKPEDAATNKDALIRYVNDLKAIQLLNAKNESKRFAVLLIHNLGQKYKDEAAIWFAHNLDWRGRVYPLATCLSPQGDEVARAMLEFANGLPLETDEAVEWLAIHGAGCYGFDKVSFEERVKWVREHEKDIVQSVESPLDCRWWTEADKPWMFLAWCHEWVGYLREGKAFVSHIAIAMDGSCNGLQNFAAMLRHEETARAVNLAPSEKPNDIYQQVADKVKARVEAIAVSDPRDSDAILAELAERSLREFSVDDEVADAERKASAERWDIVTARWIKDRIDRKLVKRPVMTYPYSVTIFGMRDQLAETLRDMHAKSVAEGKALFPIEHVGKMAGMLRTIVFESICETVTAAAKAMDWLKAAAKVIVTMDEPKPVSWVSPVGMLVLQDYRKQAEQRVECRLGGIRLRHRVHIDTAEIDTRKQAAGIAPNFVHSCDASHLMLTVNACESVGVDKFMMIHDSYGTHARNAATLARVLREQFIIMYGKQDVLAEFQAQLAQDAGSETALAIPDSPTPEHFDLSQVMNSKYFFA